jgi:mannose-1-phosphate guanylyltransferase
MEHAGNIVVARGLFAWDDVGAWSALAAHFDKDASGNIFLGKVEALDASNNIVVSGDRLTALLGVNNLVVVHAGNATLVCARERVQEIKKIVNRVGSRPDGAEFV